MGAAIEPDRSARSPAPAARGPRRRRAPCLTAARAAGIAADRIVIDPGIGFGKTVQHNLTLLRGLSLFHGLGCPVLLGASRKRFIGTLAGVEDADDRMPGSIAVALAGLAQGVQITRVHDTEATKQAVTLWQAATGAGQE